MEEIYTSLTGAAPPLASMPALSPDARPPGPPMQTEDAAASPENDPNVREAKTALDALMNAISTRDVQRARAMLGALASVAASGPLAGIVEMYKGLGASAASTINALESEETVQAIDDLDSPPPPGKSCYCKKSVQNLVMSKMSPDIKDFFDKELQRDSYGPEKERTETIAGREVTVKPQTGDDVREAYTDVTAHSLTGKEREDVRRQLGQGDNMTPEETQNLQTSLDRLKQFKINQIVEGPGTEAEKAAKLERMEKRFAEAQQKLAEARKAEAAVEQVERETREAQRTGRALPSPAMGAALRQNREERREALAETLENGVVRDAVMERPVPGRGMGTGAGLPQPPMAGRGQGGGRGGP